MAVTGSGTDERGNDFSPTNRLNINGSAPNFRQYAEDDTAQLISNPLPVDRFKGVYILFYLLGMATLLPWNFFITANGYWMYKLRDLNQTSSNSSHLSPLQLGFTTYLCVTSLVPSTVVLILNAMFGHKFSFKLRIAGGLLGVILFFTFTTVLVEVDTDDWQMAFYGVTLGSAFLINVISSVFQGGVVGLAGKFPVDYIHAVVSGQALGGIFASVANIVSIALAASPTRSAFIYFIAADVTLAICLIMYLTFSKTDFFVHYSTKRGTGPALKSTNSIDDSDEEVLVIRHNICYRRIISHIWPYLFSLALVYLVTLSLFPAVAVLVQSTGRGHGYVWNDTYFTPVACFLLMNVGDYIGRALGGVLPLPRNAKTCTVILSLARLAFVPLLMFCNALPRHNIPVYIPSDIGFILIMAAFALSNGYLSAVCFSQAPRYVEQDEQEPASSLMAAGLGIGLAVGGGLSGALVHSL